MDLIKILQERIENLPSGEYTIGVKSVLLHTEVAMSHLFRGRDKDERSAFTDAIYRTNQAYEGSLKEAYRVLTDKNPDKVTPNDIEDYFEKEGVLRTRVLTQLTTYRREWRNPSTHDYKLDFDEDEALLAIVNVSAFAIVLIDQIAGTIARNNAKKTADSKSQQTSVDESKPLRDQFSSLMPNFITQINNSYTSDVREVEIIGALSGYIVSVMPDWKVENEFMVSPSSRADLAIYTESERLLVEVKKSSFTERLQNEQAIAQITQYMIESNIEQGIVLGVVLPNGGQMVRRVSHGFLIPDRGFQEVAYIDIIAATLESEFHPDETGL